MFTDRKSFIKTFDIGVCAMTRSLSAHPSDLLALMEETAVIHSDELGYTLARLYDMQRGWALINWLAEFNRLPKWREKVTVETWTTSYDKLLCGRCFLITDSGGNRVAAASSKWLLMDMARKRPVKPDAQMLAAYTSDNADIIPCAKITAPPVDACEKTGGGSFEVKRSHTDTNRHVNNIKYIIWAEDDLSDEVFYGQTINFICANYRKEGAIGARIETACYKTDDNEYTDIIKDSENNILAEVIMKVNGV